jgi:hypothetical protein
MRNLLLIVIPAVTIKQSHFSGDGRWFLCGPGEESLSRSPESSSVEGQFDLERVQILGFSWGAFRAQLVIAAQLAFRSVANLTSSSWTGKNMSSSSQRHSSELPVLMKNFWRTTSSDCDLSWLTAKRMNPGSYPDPRLYKSRHPYSERHNQLLSVCFKIYYMTFSGAQSI